MKKSLNFDLDTKKLKEHYQNKNYTEAYNDIKKFLIKNGFEHRQGSGYISQKEMTDYKVVKIIEKLGYKYNWLSNCCKSFYYSDIKEEYDALKIIKKDKTIKIDKVKEKEQKPGKANLNKVRKLISNFQPRNRDKTNDKDIER